jgi:DNA polymerase-3 subunit epsilon
MKALFFDSETTGLPLFNEPSEDPRQPHLVQLAALLVDLDSRKTLASIDLTIAPDGWDIPEEVTKIHGITMAHALAVGIHESLALQVFFELWRSCDVRVAHNESFDARIMRIACHRYGDQHKIPTPDEWKAGRAECTQALATPILKLPPTDKMRAAGRNHHKSANLREAYSHFMGRELVDAHSAMADAQACMHVYFALKQKAAA